MFEDHDNYDNGDWYDVAQICKNGHVISSSSKSSPDHNKKFCDKCGAETITKCTDCGAEIKGYYHMSGVVGISNYKAPSFCDECGKPYPWTAAKIDAAKELVDTIDGLTEDEKKLINKDINEIVKDSPYTSASATRFKAFLIKAKGPTIEAFRDILVDITSEAAKKIIWGQ